MNKGWLLVGVVSAAALVGTAIWVADADGDAQEDELFDAAEDGEPAAGAARPDTPRGRAREGRGSALARIDTLEQQVAALEREVKMLRAASGMSARIGTEDDDEAAAGDPQFEGAVREIIENDRKEESEAEMERRRERFSEMIEASATELAAQAGLSDEQRNNVAALWQTEAERVLPLFTAGRSGERPFSEMREEIDKVRAETDAAAKKLLGESQHEAYDELRPRGRRDRDREGDRDGRRQ